MNSYPDRATAVVINTVRTNRLRNSGLLALYCLALLCVSAAAWAYDAKSAVNFNVTGVIEEPSCTVSVKPSENIDLGTVSYQVLNGKPKTGSGNVPVQLVFENCSLGTSAVTITFSGSNYDSTYSTIYKNAQTDDTGARGVGLELTSLKDMKTLGPGDRYIFALSDESEGHTFDMVARMFTPYGQITAGRVLFATTFNVSYK